MTPPNPPHWPCVLAAASCACALGCGTTIEIIDGNVAPSAHPRPADHVEVYMGKRPTKPYAEVATFDARAGSSFASSEDVVKDIRTFAGARGCDAILLTPNDRVVATRASLQKSAASQTGPQPIAVSREIGFTATCVVFKVGPDALMREP